MDEEEERKKWKIKKGIKTNKQNKERTKKKRVEKKKLLFTSHDQQCLFAILFYSNKRFSFLSISEISPYRQFLLRATNFRK